MDLQLGKLDAGGACEADEADPRETVVSQFENPLGWNPSVASCDNKSVPDRPRKKRPRDVSQRAKLIVDIATGEVEDKPEDEGKNPAAVALGRLGGQKGGKARAAKLTAARRKAIARKAAKARWG